MVAKHISFIKAYGRSMLQVLDEDFDDIELLPIRADGTFELHPDGWGRHDGMNALSDCCSPVTPAPRVHRDPVVEDNEWKQQDESAHFNSGGLWLNDDVPVVLNRELEELTLWVSHFPHILYPFQAQRTAEAYLNVGPDDCKRRGISVDEWLWRHSRAGTGNYNTAAESIAAMSEWYDG